MGGCRFRAIHGHETAAGQEPREQGEVGADWTRAEVAANREMFFTSTGVTGSCEAA